MKIAEITQPANISTELIRRFGGRVMRFRELPALAQKAIIVRGREHLDPDEPVPRMNPNMRFGYVEIPMEALKQAIFTNLQQHNPDSGFKSFDDYHNWYVSHGDTPAHTAVWPIELETEYPEDTMIADGSHRFHSYVRSGVQVVPAIYRP